MKIRPVEDEYYYDEHDEMSYIRCPICKKNAPCEHAVFFFEYFTGSDPYWDFNDQINGEEIEKEFKNVYYGSDEEDEENEECDDSDNLDDSEEENPEDEPQTLKDYFLKMILGLESVKKLNLDEIIYWEESGFQCYETITLVGIKK